MAFAAAYFLIVGGVCACSPLFKRASTGFAKFLSGVGFFVGIGIVIVAADITLRLGLLGIYSTPPQGLDDHQYLRFWLPLILILGVLLFSRPIRSLRWASLVAVAAGLLAAYYVKFFLPSLTAPILVVAFLIATIAVYALLRFVEDLVEFVGTVLAFPPVAAIIGLVSVFFGILIVAFYP